MKGRYTGKNSPLELRGVRTSEKRAIQPPQDRLLELMRERYMGVYDWKVRKEGLV